METQAQLTLDQSNLLRLIIERIQSRKGMVGELRRSILTCLVQQPHTLSRLHDVTGKDKGNIRTALMEMADTYGVVAQMLDGRYLIVPRVPVADITVIAAQGESASVFQADPNLIDGIRNFLQGYGLGYRSGYIQLEVCDLGEQRADTPESDYEKLLEAVKRYRETLYTSEKTRFEEAFSEHI